VAWAVVYSYSIIETIELAFFMIVRDYLLTGIVVATILWFTSNRLLLSPPSHSTPADSRVEWAYAFDVHTNAFFPLYLTLYLAQLFLLPVIFKDNWVCLWVGNTLYLAAFAQYTYGIYLGLNGEQPCIALRTDFRLTLAQPCRSLSALNCFFHRFSHFLPRT